MAIRMFELQNSQIKSVSYDPCDQFLFVSFHPAGSTYKYKGVSRDTFLDFLLSESPERFLNAQIKGSFEYEKVESLEPDSSLEEQAS